MYDRPLCLRYQYITLKVHRIIVLECRHSPKHRSILGPSHCVPECVEVRVAAQILLNSLRRLLTVVPQTEHTLSRWCGSHSGQRPGSPNAGPPSPGRDGAPPPGALTHDGPGTYSSSRSALPCQHTLYT